MTAPVLKAGRKAYLDSFAGLVPIVVLGITGESGAPSTNQLVRYRVTETVGAFKKGEVDETFALWAIPPKALVKQQFHTRIGPYTVECDVVVPRQVPSFDLCAC